MKTYTYKSIWHKGMLVMALCLTGSSITVLADESGDVSKGAQAWANTCARCHNIRNASEFRDDLWTPIVNHMRIRAGIPGNMTRDIRAFLQSSNYAARTVSLGGGNGRGGQEVYASTCIACHGPDGKGALPGVPALHDRLVQSTDDVLMQRIANGFQSAGSIMAMPARGGNPSLTDADIRNVMSYLRSQFGK